MTLTVHSAEGKLSGRIRRDPSDGMASQARIHGREPVAMSSSDAIPNAAARLARSCFPYFVLLGVYLTLRGYHSFDGDQAYRLPLLLHRQDMDLYADDPFVRAVDDFNPHRGSLALLDMISRPVGLPAGLFLVFALTFLGTCRAVTRLTLCIWPALAPGVGWFAVGLFLAAKAGNIGTNHLFEAMMLDRLAALALGWLAIAAAVASPEREWWRASLAVAVATLVHPSVGLQVAMGLGAAWIAWAALPGLSEVPRATAIRGLASLGLAVIPGLSVNLPQSATLLGELPASLFWKLSVELQNPQHMLPHLWRMPQWLAWFSYLALAGLELIDAGRRAPRTRDRERADEGPIAEATAPRWRIAILLGGILVGLFAAWYAIEVRRIVQVAIFQPFRMGTVVRGLAIVVVSGRITRLWKSAGFIDRTRAAVLATGFLGDWLLVVAAAAELAVWAIEAIRHGIGDRWMPRGVAVVVFAAMILSGLNFLAHHDTESGHVPLLAAVGFGIIAGSRIWRQGARSRLRSLAERATSRRLATAFVAWIFPFAAFIASRVPPEHPAARWGVVHGLVDRCRFCPFPLDDVERLALWCRDHTPASARFVGPPGPKTFRLWARRSLAFNRSGSPYHGAGLADWFARFAQHVDYRGTPEEFVRDYVGHRHDFEARYEALSDSQRAALALRQGADHVIAETPKQSPDRSNWPAGSPLEWVHSEGRYAVYRVNPSALVHRQP